MLIIHDFRHFGLGAVPLLDRLERRPAQLQSSLIRFAVFRDARVQVPAQIIELRTLGQTANILSRFLFEMKEGENHVGDLDAGIVDIVLHLNAAAGKVFEANERVAEHRVAQVADMRGLVGIDAGVLDDDLGGIGRRHGRLPSRFFARGPEKIGAVEKRVQVAASGDFDPRDAFDRLQRIRDLLRQRPRRLFQPLGQLERQRVAELERRRIVERRELAARSLDQLGAAVAEAAAPQPRQAVEDAAAGAGAARTCSDSASLSGATAAAAVFGKFFTTASMVSPFDPAF